jgi:glutamate dehydrogenase/leucine dehydrogenase
MQSFYWSEKEVNNKLWEVITNAFNRVYEFHKTKDFSMRMSAFSVSIEHLSKAMLWRGFFP